MRRLLASLVLLVASAPAWALIYVSNDGIYTWFPSVVAVPQTSDPLGTIQAVSPSTSGEIPTYGSCDQSWAQFVYGSPYACNPYGVGAGTCRDPRVVVSANRTHGQTATCTYDAPGSTGDIVVHVQVD